MPQLVFTNGCFDLLHPGHVDLLIRSRALGDRLVIGLNSDASVRSIKGAGRPFIPQDDRAFLLRSLRCVDEVTIFHEPTPARLIADIQPDVLVKGGDWAETEIVGAELVRRRGGQVISLPLRPGYSTTAMSEQIATVCRRAGASTVETLIKQDAAAGQLIREAGRVVIDALCNGVHVFMIGDGEAENVARYVASRLTAAPEEAGAPGAGVLAVATSLPISTVKQCHAMPDVVIAMTAGEPSKEILQAVMAARECGYVTVGIAGARGRRLTALSDFPIVVAGDDPSAVIEAQIGVGHVIRSMLARALSPASKSE